MQANYGETEIKSLLSKVKIFNKEIGAYQAFAITEDFDYVVKLSNGNLQLKIEELKDNEIEAITPAQLIVISNRFISTNSKNNNQAVSNSSSQITQQKNNIPKKKNGVLKSILVIVLIVLSIVCGIYFSNNINVSEENVTSQAYSEQVLTIEEYEWSQPTNFLFANGTYSENFWGNKIKVNCEIANNATVATYKDVVVRITYFTKTKSVIGTKEYTIYEVFPPKTSKAISLKIENYKDVKSISWEVISALPY